jgi:hypothetical protein
MTEPLNSQYWWAGEVDASWFPFALCGAISVDLILFEFCWLYWNFASFPWVHWIWFPFISFHFPLFYVILCYFMLFYVISFSFLFFFSSFTLLSFVVFLCFGVPFCHARLIRSCRRFRNVRWEYRFPLSEARSRRALMILSTSASHVPKVTTRHSSYWCALRQMVSGDWSPRRANLSISAGISI